MKRFAVLIILTIIGVGVWIVGGKLSSDAIAMIAGWGLGAMVGASWALTFYLERKDLRQERRRLQQERPAPGAYRIVDPATGRAAHVMLESQQKYIEDRRTC